LFDEATSALDASAEAAVDDMVASLATQRTIVWVTHRLAGVVGADRIITLVGGRVAEEGTHQQLLAGGGPYADMWSKQSGFLVGADGDPIGIPAARSDRIPLFRGRAAPRLELPARRFDTQHVAAARTLFEAGDPADAFYVTARGQLVVERPDQVPGEPNPRLA